MHFAVLPPTRPEQSHSPVAVSADILAEKMALLVLQPAANVAMIRHLVAILVAWDWVPDRISDGLLHVPYFFHQGMFFSASSTRALSSR
jgi:hypothetical protein